MVQTRRESGPAAPVERYLLYGEPVQSVEARFLHVEPIHLRSGRHHWTIAPHAHADLHQILLVTQGGGVMRAEAEHWVEVFGMPNGALAERIRALEGRPENKDSQ